jgi:hypothetical protein
MAAFHQESISSHRGLLALVSVDRASLLSSTVDAVADFCRAKTLRRPVYDRVVPA